MTNENDYRTDSGSNCPNIRATLIGATDAPVILGLSPYKNQRDLLIEKTMPMDRWTGNDATDAGTLLESPILAYAERELGKLNRDVRLRAVGVDFPLAATLDGQLVDSGRPVEAKTSGITGPLYGTWGDALTDQVPEVYLVQVQVQLFVTGADLAYLYALLGGRGFVRYEIPANAELQEIIVAKCGEWWRRHVIEREPIEGGESPSLEVVRRIRRQPNKTVDLTNEHIYLLSRLEIEKNAIKAGEKERDRLQAELISALSDAEAGMLPDGRMLTYFETSRNGYTVYPTTYRTLRVKKG